MAFSKYFGDYNTSSRCIYQNGLIELCPIHMLQMKTILFYVLLYIVSRNENVQKCNNRIKFKIKDLFYARNGELLSLSLEHKE